MDTTQIEQTQDSVDTNKEQEIDTKRITLIVIVGLIIVLVVYFCVTFFLSPRLDITDTSLIGEENTQQNFEDPNTMPPATNEAYTPDTPKEYWLVEGMNTDILNTRITQEFGRILAHPERGASLYIKSDGDCILDCLNAWMPYESQSEIADGDIGTIYRSDTETYQYTWKGKPLYRFKADTLVHKFEGNGVDGVWEFARP